MKSVLELAEEDKTAAKILHFRAMQADQYEVKVRRAERRAWEFYNHPEIDGNCFVSVGGLDSITLLVFLRSIGINVPAVKVGVIQEFGWPVLSKEISKNISRLQHPTTENAVTRHAVITGIKGDGTPSKRMKLAKKWLEKFGGYENDNEGVNYKKPDFLVSDQCCWYMKELPLSLYAKETGQFPYEGLMASEGGRRALTLPQKGCNYISPGTKRSCPFATFHRQDLLQLALDLHAPVPEIYGEIVRDPDGTLRTTKAQRTGCSMCGFGIHLEKRPHRFDRLWERSPGEWEMWMNHVDKLPDGTWYGWGHVLDYIGVEWREPWRQFEVQVSLYD